MSLSLYSSHPPFLRLTVTFANSTEHNCRLRVAGGGSEVVISKSLGLEITCSLGSKQCNKLFMRTSRTGRVGHCFQNQLWRSSSTVALEQQLHQGAEAMEVGEEGAS